MSIAEDGADGLRGGTACWWGGCGGNMMNPPLEELVKKVDSKYTLVVAAAKRARELMQGQAPLVETRSNKPVTIALEEIQAGKVRWERARKGIK